MLCDEEAQLIEGDNESVQSHGDASGQSSGRKKPGRKPMSIEDWRKKLEKLEEQRDAGVEGLEEKIRRVAFAIPQEGDIELLGADRVSTMVSTCRYNTDCVV